MQPKPTPSGPVRLPAAGTTIPGDLAVPPEAEGLVVLAFASGEGRHRRDERELASFLNRDRLATVLVDLLTPEEEAASIDGDRVPGDDVLATRLDSVLAWARGTDAVRALPVARLTEPAPPTAALAAAARRPGEVKALVLRGGAVDAADKLGRTGAPTLVLVGDRANEDAAKEAGARTRGELRVEWIPSRSPVADAPDATGVVARASSAWLARHLAAG